MPDHPAVPPLGARIDQLFALVPRAGRDADGPTAPARFTTGDAAAVLQGDLGLSRAKAMQLIAELRASTSDAELELDEPLDGILASLARMFGTTLEYFGAEAGPMSAAEDALIGRSMAMLDIRAVVVCRALIARGAPLKARLRASIKAALSADEKAVAVDRTSFVKQHHVRPVRWQHHAHGEARRPGAAGDASGGSARRGRSVVSLTVTEIRALCVQLLHHLDLAPPLDPHELCRRLAEHRGRPIKLVPLEVNAASSVGHLNARERFDLIVYRDDAPAPLQAHVIYHEVMHLLLDHLDGIEGLICGTFVDDPEGEPSLYSEVQEWEAETGATILSELASRPEDPQWVSRDTTNTDLVATFGLTGGRW